MKEERLQKYIARCGIASRRKAEEIILQGNVKVNGIIVKELGSKISPEKDVVTVYNKRIQEKEEHIYIKLYKPEGYITTVKDQFNRKTVLDLVNIKERIYPIGRLDYDTSGLLLLTDDGDLANKLMHPKYHIFKTYEADIKGSISEDSINILKNGILIDGYKTAPAKVKLINRSQKNTSVQISIHEGKNRQVRKMFEKIGHRVIKLKRISFGNINLGGLMEGQWIYLTDDEIKYLKR
ncbi:MAG: pseudouridine synthase [Tissierellia bacterium]|nr:pseudouridine synthase [Tissierellia bacterium]MDD3226596.1 pseudouridine synthase [Tissierellia bacterium]MDD3750436.1 pseudouridine synthase [Tissierellia bacterium]MDD4045581.1 pseudouridine synthase [Tissierellia bacterium]MDD4678423.1 pseudouridine synthase [Tissierellia bacterium]